MKRRGAAVAISRLAAAAAAMAALAGCARSGAPPAPPARTSFPITLTDALGQRVTVRAKPQRIVSLAPAMTETLFALGLGDRVVGVTEYCDYPPAARSKPKIGGIVNPSLERILAQQPDLVLGMRLNPKPLLAALIHAGVPAYAADPRNVEQVLETIEAVGALTGQREGAQRLTRSLRARLGAVQRASGTSARPTVILLYSDQPLWVAGSGTFPDDVIRLAGGRNAASKVTGYKQYSVEALLAANPDVVFLTSMEGGDDQARLRAFLNRPSMRNLDAVKNRRVYLINADIVDRAAPRIVEGVSQMAQRLHPAAFKPRG